MHMFVILAIVGSIIGIGSIVLAILSLIWTRAQMSGDQFLMTLAIAGVGTSVSFISLTYLIHHFK